jgi:hypothetical protein
VSARGAGEGLISVDTEVLHARVVGIALVISIYKLSALSYPKPDLTYKAQLMKGEIEHSKTFEGDRDAYCQNRC